MNGSKDLKTIIYFKGVYDTLDLFTDHLIGAFEAMGYGTFVYHTANEEVSKSCCCACWVNHRNLQQ